MKRNENDRVGVSFDLSSLASLTAQQKAELVALKNIPDSAIDYTDIPALDEVFGRTLYGQDRRTKSKSRWELMPMYLTMLSGTEKLTQPSELSCQQLI